MNCLSGWDELKIGRRNNNYASPLLILLIQKRHGCTTINFNG
jgi:hypothetical protein